MNALAPIRGGGDVSAKDERDMDRLAEQVADGRSLNVAASRLGLSPWRAEFLWLRIVARLGPQAET
jgi:hypothetical protein